MAKTKPSQDEPSVSGTVVGFVRHDGKAYRDCPATFPQSAALRLAELGRFIIDGPVDSTPTPVPEPEPEPEPEQVDAAPEPEPESEQVDELPL